MHQAVKPHGAMGVVMGWFLESGNAVQNRATVEASTRRPAPRCWRWASARARRWRCRPRPALGLVAGVDPSELMVASARRRLDSVHGRGSPTRRRPPVHASS